MPKTGQVTAMGGNLRISEFFVDTGLMERWGSGRDIWPSLFPFRGPRFRLSMRSPHEVTHAVRELALKEDS